MSWITDRWKKKTGFIGNSMYLKTKGGKRRVESHAETIKKGKEPGTVLGIKKGEKKLKPQGPNSSEGKSGSGMERAFGGELSRP